MRFCRVDQSVNILTDYHKVLIFICSSKVFRYLVVAMNLMDFKLFAAYGAPTKLGTIQRNS